MMMRRLGFVAGNHVVVFVKCRSSSSVIVSSSRKSITTKSEIVGDAKSKVAKAIRKHREIENVLGSGNKQGGSSVAAASSDGGNHTNRILSEEKERYFLQQYRQNRFRQAMINATLSFFTVVLGAQGVKNAHEKRKTEREYERVQNAHEQDRTAIKSIVQDPQVFVSPLTNEILHQIQQFDQEKRQQQQQTDASNTWFSSLRSWILPPTRSTTTKHLGRKYDENDDDREEEADKDYDAKHLNSTTEHHEKLIRQIIVKHLQERLGRLAMTQEERDKNDLSQLVQQQQQVVSSSHLEEETSSTSISPTVTVSQHQQQQHVKKEMKESKERKSVSEKTTEVGKYDESEILRRLLEEQMTNADEGDLSTDTNATASKKKQVVYAF